MKRTPGVAWAYGVKLGYCDNVECDAIHIDLMKEDGRVFATAPVDRDTARLFGEEFLKFARGENRQ